MRQSERLMKRIIIYGVSNVIIRRNIEYFLDNTCYEIFGYSDRFYAADVLDGKYFIKPETLAEQDVDFILLSAATQASRDAMRRDLIQHSVPEEKLVDLKLLVHHTALDINYDLIGMIERDYQEGDNLIFGLSYSRRGILEDRLNGAFYDCSESGLDLYYNHRIFQHIGSRFSLSKASKALLVFPYYYFDYDMSLTKIQYEAWRLCALFRLDDWHNYRKTPDGVDYVENYRMFGKRFSQFYHSPRFQLRTDAVFQGSSVDLRISEKRFFDDFKETAEENKRIFKQFIQNIKEAGMEPVLIIPPIYLEGLSRESLEAVQRKKERFYRILKEIDVEGYSIFDYTDLYHSQRALFIDVTHLNTVGAEAFTKQINTDIL